MDKRIIAAALSAAVAVPALLAFGSRQGDKLDGNLKYVNMFMGTSGDHGQIAPAAAVPFGMVSLCPDSNPGQHVGYDWSVALTDGVSLNRISGVGCSGVGGNLRIKPSAYADSLYIVKGSETASPGSYSAKFSNGVECFLTASCKTAFERYVFPRKGGVVSMDFASSFEKRKVSCEYNILSDREIEGRISAGTACAFGKYTLYFRLASDSPFEIISAGETVAELRFSRKSVEIRVSLSPIGCGDAAAELASWSGVKFGKVERAAASSWREKLDRISVSGSTEEQKRLFYTSLYRIYLSPMDVTSHDGKYKGSDGNIYSADGYRAYSSWSMWDTYRAKFPMLALLEPEAMEDIARSCVNLYRTGKKNWATENECAPTVRTEHMGIMLLDAYRKGVPVDFLPGYDGMVREVMTVLPRKSPDNRLELANDLWALADIASILGSRGDSMKFAAESEKMFEDVWKRYFMDISPDFPKMRSNGLYQGTLWQYRWACPQYADKMMEWCGAERLSSELDSFFSLGMFNQGNEPDIHAPFMFNCFGSPELTYKWVGRYLTDDGMKHIYGGSAEYPEPYVGRAFRDTPDGYAPEMDEDDGTMSAWYMFAQLGFYPVKVGTDEYVLFPPLFDDVHISLEGGGQLRIRTVGRGSCDAPLKEIRLDGKTLEKPFVRHSDLISSECLEYIF